MGKCRLHNVALGHKGWGDAWIPGSCVGLEALIKTRIDRHCNGILACLCELQDCLRVGT